VVVVDNGSSDDSLQFLQSLREPRLRIVALPANRGFAGGCNAGIARAEGRYIATFEQRCGSGSELA
jgi:GT2 family glycosyltransferase